MKNYLEYNPYLEPIRRLVEPKESLQVSYNNLHCVSTQDSAYALQAAWRLLTGEFKEPVDHVGAYLSQVDTPHKRTLVSDIKKREMPDIMVMELDEAHDNRHGIRSNLPLITMHYLPCTPMSFREYSIGSPEILCFAYGGRREEIVSENVYDDRVKFRGPSASPAPRELITRKRPLYQSPDKWMATHVATAVFDLFLPTVMEGLSANPTRMDLDRARQGWLKRFYHQSDLSGMDSEEPGQHEKIASLLRETVLNPVLEKYGLEAVTARWKENCTIREMVD